MNGTFLVGFVVGVEVGCGEKLGAIERVTRKGGTDDGALIGTKDGLLDGCTTGVTLETGRKELVGWLEGRMGAEDGNEVGC